jgi:hypothetical protein
MKKNFFIVALVLINLLLILNRYYAKPRADNPFDHAPDYLKNRQFLAIRQAYLEYLASDPKITQCLLGVGSTHFLTNDYEGSLPYYQVAWALGSEQGLKCIGAVYLQLSQLDKFSKILPLLQAHEADNQEIAMEIAFYAYRTEKSDLFRQTCGFISKDFLKNDPANLQYLINESDHFKLDGLKEKYLNLQRQLKQENDNNQKLNSPGS